MGQSPASRVALLSIKPDYAEAILAGDKKIEFRRSRLAGDISVVVVYATQPVGRVTGWFEVDEVIEDSPTALWNRFSAHGGVSRSVYREYFRSASRAFGIRVRRARRLAKPADLDEIKPGMRAPQSFQYVPAASFRALLSARS